ncbi:hypothetical protein [Parasitella parasitica]|uniref:UBX domain-containing protein n=1 Tax=Parasitella parasitica TaxID=35722 RepID=A0A0B7NG77_9FUNG|nr:hypothetical protein [Parasitella parasitica]
MSDQDIVQFCEITGATSSDARTFLEIAENDVASAISIYLENNGSQQAIATSSSSSFREDPMHQNHGNPMTDEEIARQMQEMPEVRAPIAPKMDNLVGGSVIDLYSSSVRPMRDTAGNRPSPFNQGDSATGSVAEFLNRLNSSGPESSSSGSSLEPFGSSATVKAKKLADLFRPPFDIMFCGNFEKARETAKEKNKWLMINVQDPTEFSCQKLNRDLWSDQFVKDIIKESFIFLQYNNTNPDGTRYSTYYTISGYPHIAIIDARTGERIKVWEKELTPTDFMMDVTEFMEENSPDNPAKRPKKAMNISDMSEEEQLNAAIAASLKGPNEDTASKLPEGSQMDTEPKETNEANERSLAHKQDKQQQKEELKAGSAFDDIKPVKRDETTDIVNSTRIQLKMGDGSRIIRRFLKTDPVRSIFEFIKSDVSDVGNREFELVFNRTQLIDVLDQTIEEAGLTNAAVNCVIV